MEASGRHWSGVSTGKVGGREGEAECDRKEGTKRKMILLGRRGEQSSPEEVRKKEGRRGGVGGKQISPEGNTRGEYAMGKNGEERGEEEEKEIIKIPQIIFNIHFDPNVNYYKGKLYYAC